MFELGRKFPEFARGLRQQVGSESVRRIGRVGFGVGRSGGYAFGVGLRGGDGRNLDDRPQRFDQVVALSGILQNVEDALRFCGSKR